MSLSSGESEFYGEVKAASEGLGLQALARDWAVDVGVKVRCDSSSARAIASRRGLGRVRHIEVRYLWLQERVARKHILIEAVATDRNLADLLTKALGAKQLDKLLVEMNLYFVDGQSARQKETLKAG